jgi:AraC-like DNA-binding protein
MIARNSFLQTSHLPNYQKQWLSEIEKCIIDQIHNPNLLVSDIALKLGISERKLFRRVKKISDMTPKKLIQYIRLEMARKHLEGGDFETIIELAHAVGYKRADYFSMLFARRFGKRPVEFLR